MVCRRLIEVGLPIKKIPEIMSGAVDIGWDRIE